MEHFTGVNSGAGEVRGGNQAIKIDKVDNTIVNHCSAFGKLFSGVMLLQYLLLFALYSIINTNADFIKVFYKVYEAVNDFSIRITD